MFKQACRQMLKARNIALGKQEKMSRQIINNNEAGQSTTGNDSESRKRQIRARKRSRFSPPILRLPLSGSVAINYEMNTVKSMFESWQFNAAAILGAIMFLVVALVKGRKELLRIEIEKLQMEMEKKNGDSRKSG